MRCIARIPTSLGAQKFLSNTLDRLRALPGPSGHGKKVFQGVIQLVTPDVLENVDFSLIFIDFSMVLGQNLAFSPFCAKSRRSTRERARRTREGSQESRRTKERAGDIPEWSRMKYERIGKF